MENEMESQIGMHRNLKESIAKTLHQLWAGSISGELASSLPTQNGMTILGDRVRRLKEYIDSSYSELPQERKDYYCEQAELVWRSLKNG
jgi:hypothetical protein